MQRREVRAVLFDMDGVLVDSYEAWRLVINDALISLGRKPLSKAAAKKHFGAPIEKDAKTHFKGLTPKQIKALYIAHYWGRRDKVKLFSHTKPLLECARKNKLKVALISNSAKKIINATLAYFKMRKYFHVIMTMDDVKRRKPHPEMVLTACKKLGVNPKNAIVVGDTQNDMRAGKRAGCFTIGFGTKGNLCVTNLLSIRKFLKIRKR